MSISLGLDVGAVSVKLAALGEPEDRPLLTHLARASSSFFLPKLPKSNRFSDCCLALSTYRRLQGHPREAASDLLREFCELVPEEAIAGIRLTGSGGRTVAHVLNAEFENEFRALARSMHAFYPQVRSVFEMGGETSKYVRLSPTDGADRLGILDYQCSTECAAGTGSFIDQQASRLLYEVEDVGAAARGASCAARVAGRCSVFAKTDMIHAQQKGYATDQILRGLCEAVARNFKSSIVKGRQVVSPVAFIGGVALNAGVREALREAFKLPESDFLVPETHCWMTALGASILAKEGNGHGTSGTLRRLRAGTTIAEEFPTSEALTLDHVTLLRDRVPPLQLPAVGSREHAYLGIDVGSVSTNLVVIDSSGTC